ncbi:MAG: hypothetical protein PHC34_06070 [Candidatus Gastranaerophilales bacterium]|nr:hypothetical protein [Candidatus Gastranaerophilales bacterium]
MILQFLTRQALNFTSTFYIQHKDVVGKKRNARNVAEKYNGIAGSASSRFSVQENLDKQAKKDLLNAGIKESEYKIFPQHDVPSNKLDYVIGLK